MTVESPQKNFVSYWTVLEADLGTSGVEAVHPSAVARWKRVLDILMSAFGIVFSLPVMALIAILIKLDSNGPIFYRQLRVGLNQRGGERRRLHRRIQSRPTSRRDDGDRRIDDTCGQPFYVLKFRTMRIDAECNGPSWCQKNDPRVTRLGRILRKTHLDEIPQLFNILAGEMSLVGPRPERPEFVKDLRKAIPGYERRLSVKPGLTGLAQIRHRADLHVRDVRKKVRYDTLYLRSMSLMTDLKILAGTFPTAVGLDGEDIRRLGQARKNLFAFATAKR